MTSNQTRSIWKTAAAATFAIASIASTDAPAQQAKHLKRQVIEIEGNGAVVIERERPDKIVLRKPVSIFDKGMFYRPHYGWGKWAGKPNASVWESYDALLRMQRVTEPIHVATKSAATRPSESTTRPVDGVGDREATPEETQAIRDMLNRAAASRPTTRTDVQ